MAEHNLKADSIQAKTGSDIQVKSKETYSEGFAITNPFDVVYKQWVADFISEFTSRGIGRKDYILPSGENVIVDDDPDTGIIGFFGLVLILDANAPQILTSGTPVDNQGVYDAVAGTLTFPSADIEVERYVSFVYQEASGDPDSNLALASALALKVDKTYVDSKLADEVVNRNVSIAAEAAIRLAADTNEIAARVVAIGLLQSQIVENTANILDVSDQIAAETSRAITEENDIRDDLALKADSSSIDTRLVLTTSDLTDGVDVDTIYNNAAWSTKVVGVDYEVELRSTGKKLIVPDEITNISGGGFTLQFSLNANDKLDILGTVSIPTNNIQTWSAKAFASGSQVYYRGLIWESNAITLSTDIPGTSTKWVNKSAELYGPYDSLAAANANVPAIARLTATIGLITDNGIVEYFWKNGTLDTDLVEKTPFDQYFDTSKNKFNADTDVVEGFYLRSDTGALSAASATSAYSNYIPVKAGVSYTLSGVPSLNPQSANVIVFYDRDKVKLSQISGTGNFTHTTPANTAYVRFNIRYLSNTKDYTKVQYERAGVATSYQRFGDVLKTDKLRIDDIYLKTELFNKYVIRSKNLFNGSVNTGFYLVSTNGLPGANSTSAYSDFIEVEPNTTYTLSGTVSLSTLSANTVVFYDASYTPISWVNDTTNFTHTTPTGTKYVRFNVRYVSATADYTAVQYEKGSVATSYAPYGNVLNYDLLKVADTFTTNELFTKYIIISKNLFDGVVTNGAYLQSTNGLPSGTAATSAYSNYIPVVGGATYTLSGAVSLNPSTANVVVFYDSDYNVLSWVSNTGAYTHTVPGSASFVRFNVRYNSTTADYSSLQYERSASATSYEPFGSTLNYDLLRIDSEFVSNSKFNKYIEVSKNLFNKNGLIHTGFYLSSVDGLPAGPASTSAYGDYIEVKGSTTYTLSGTVSLSNPAANVVVFYDENKDIIYWVNNISNYTHTTPSNAKYVRFNIRYVEAIPDYSQVQYEEGATATSYATYGSTLHVDFIEGVDLSDGGDGGTPAVDPMISAITKVHLVPFFGQSLSINTGAGASTFSAPVSIAYDVNLTNTNIQDMNGGFAEMVLALSKEDKKLPDNYKIMTCLGGAGGKSVLELSKGSSYYNTVMANIATGKATADAAGLSFSVPAIVWVQGEEDMNTGGVDANYGSGVWNPLQYKAKLKILIDDFNTDIKALTGQTNHVKWIMYQTGSHNVYYRYPRIAIQQLELAAEDERVTLAKTMYEVDYNADGAHAPAKTYRNMGNHFGVAFYKTVFLNERVLPVYPAQYYIVGNDVFIRMPTKYQPLVFDTTIVAPQSDGNYGFQLYTVTNETAGATGTIAPATETITSVTLVSADTVKVSLSALPPAGTRLTYAVNGDGHDQIGGSGTGGHSGRTLGPRGNIRDSRTYINPVANYFELYNWAAIFEIIL